MRVARGTSARTVELLAAAFVMHYPLAFRPATSTITAATAVLAFLLRLRTRAQRLFRFSDTHRMLLWAGAAGLFGAFATITFRESIRALQWLLVGSSGSLVDIALGLPLWARVTLPTLGGLCAGGFLLLGRRFAVGTASSDYMEAVAIGDGRLSIRHSLARSVSSLCTIASGGSIGREGSMVQLAALASSALGRFAHFDPPRLRLLVACGAAAGITSAYNAPIAGAFFVSEILLGSIAMENFGPLVVASVVANITMRELPGYRPTYEMPMFPEIAGGQILLFIGLGGLCGIAAPQFLRLLDFAKGCFNRTQLPLPIRLGLGGLLVGMLSIWAPEVWGNGYSVVNSILHQPWTWQALLAALIFKVVATALTTGSGAVGGVFTPTLFVGATIGCLFGQAVHLFSPQATSAPFAYAIVGMGAFLSAATYAPLMAILMIFEMTLSYQAMLPLALACVVGYVVARASDEASMYDVTIRRNQEEKERLRLAAMRVGELVRPAETMLSENAPFSELTRMFLEYPVKYLYVVDDARRFLGVIPLQAITSHLLEKRDTSTTRAVDFVRRDFAHLTPDMSLGDALQHFVAFQGERLPVVHGNDLVLLGVVYKTSLLEAYCRLSGVG